MSKKRSTTKQQERPVAQEASSHPAPAGWWTVEPPSGEVSAAIERLRRAKDVVQVAVMPDVHVAGPVCVGTAFATTRLIYPGAIGGDIGCGVSVMRFNGEATVLKDKRRAQKVLRALGRFVPVNRHGVESRERVLPNELEDLSLASPQLEAKRRNDGRQQLGTLGGGNHFAELQADDEGALWLMVHSGSRAMGQAVRDHHVDSGTRSRGGLTYLDAESDEGRSYLNDMGWALDYAKANREALVFAVACAVEDALGMAPDESTHASTHHNSVRREAIGEDMLWVHRKGAIPATANEPAAIPGSMGTASFHTVGRGCTAALNSCSHGAGRRFSRGVARSRITRRVFEDQMRGVWHDARMAGKLRDEAPGAYRDIDKVMRAQHELTKVVRRLVPILSYKGA